MIERKQMLPNPPKADTENKPPRAYVKLGVFGWKFYVQLDGREFLLFKKFTMWPSRASRRNAVHIADTIDWFIEKAFERGFASGMHPHDKLTEPKVHTDGGSVYHVEMFPFAVRRSDPTSWIIAYAGWVADLTLKNEELVLIPRAKSRVVEHRRDLSNVRTGNFRTKRKSRETVQGVFPAHSGRDSINSGVIVVPAPPGNTSDVGQVPSVIVPPET